MDAPDSTPRTGADGRTRSEADVLALYLSFPNETVALAVAEVLVDRRLVACVNVLTGVVSVFRWEGEVAREREVVAIAKTTRGTLAAAIEAVAELHPYDLPCAVAYESAGGLVDYLDWVAQETT